MLKGWTDYITVNIELSMSKAKTTITHLKGITVFHGSYTYIFHCDVTVHNKSTVFSAQRAI
jgi:hypothetical protein